MVQVKAPATKTDNLSLIPQWKERTDDRKFSSDLHIYATAGMSTYTHITQNKQINVQGPMAQAFDSSTQETDGSL